jgi:ribosomal protein S13
MARIAGVDLPRNKHANIALTYIYGIGTSRAARILDAAKVDPMKKVSDLAKTRSTASARSSRRKARSKAICARTFR